MKTTPLFFFRTQKKKPHIKSYPNNAEKQTNLRQTKTGEIG